MSCTFKYAEQFRDTNPELADSLNERGLQVWSLIKDSNLFKEKDGKYSLSGVGTAKRKKQVEFIDSMPNYVYLEDNSVVVDLSMFPDLEEGLEWLRKVMPEANIELVDSLIDGIGKGSYNTVTDLITLATKYANKQTIKHEVFHAAFNRLSKEKQEEILNEGSKLFGIPRGESKVITKYSKEQQESIDYMLKSVDLLQSDKGNQIFNKGEKNKWSLDKILTELAIPKEQKQLLLDLGITDREQLALELAANYSYSVEINTAKNQEITSNEQLPPIGSKIGFNYNNSFYEIENEIDFSDGRPMNIVNYYKDGKSIKYEEYNEAEKNSKQTNSSYYSNLTVPGGTNYTENEIATPAITPSIKGHAQFATSNGIGWFRADESQQYQETDIQSIIDNLQKSGQLEINCK